jgi:hypothetical protein
MRIKGNEVRKKMEQDRKILYEKDVFEDQALRIISVQKSVKIQIKRIKIQKIR